MRASLECQQRKQAKDYDDDLGIHRHIIFYLTSVSLSRFPSLNASITSFILASFLQQSIKHMLRSVCWRYIVCMQEMMDHWNNVNLCLCSYLHVDDDASGFLDLVSIPILPLSPFVGNQRYWLWSL